MKVDAPKPDRTDVALITGPTDDNKGARIVRLKDDEVTVGEVRALEEGKPIQGEVLKLTPRKDNANVCDVAVVYPIRPVFLVVEGSGATTRDETEYYITPGAVWKINDDCEIRASIPIGVTRAAGDYGIIVGATFAFDNLFHRSDEKH